MERRPGRLQRCRCFVPLEPVNDVFASVRGLRASRNFLPQAIEDAKLEAILEAARWTGSSKNTQRWSFVVVDKPSGIKALATAGSFTRAIENAPVTIALVKEAEGNDFDIGRAAQNIMLAADALGIGSCPITLHKMDTSAKVLGLTDGQEAHYAVALGYVDAEAEKAERKERRASGWGGRRQDVVHKLEE